MITASGLLTDFGFRKISVNEYEYGGRAFRLIEDPHDVVDIAVHHRKTHKNYAWLSRVVGQSRVTENGEHWDDLYANTQRWFRDPVAEEVGLCIERSLKDFSLRLAESEGKFDLDSLKRLAADIICRLIIGGSIEAVGLNWSEVLFANKTSLEFAFVTKGRGNFSRDKMSRVTAAKIDATETLMRWKPERRVGYREATGKLSVLSRSDAAELFSFFFGPVDTVSVMFGWLLRRISEVPDVDREFAKPDAIRKFVVETLKLYPPMPIVSRDVDEEISLRGGGAVSKDTSILLSLLGDPEGMKSFISLSAFSFGARMCPGRNIAFRIAERFLSYFLDARKIPEFEAEIDPKWAVLLEDGNHFRGRMRSRPSGNIAGVRYSSGVNDAVRISGFRGSCDG